MFFIGIFGIEQKQIKIADLKIECKNCNNTQDSKIIKVYNFLHFFFIPIFKWNEKYYAICSNCNSLYNIPKEKGKQFEKGIIKDISYWDFKTVKIGSPPITCPNCNKTLKDNFEYCPYCGQKLQ